MTKAIVNAKYYGPQEDGARPHYFGYACEIENGYLVADVPEELLPSELAAGRVRFIGAPVVEPVVGQPRLDRALLAEIEAVRNA